MIHPSSSCRLLVPPKTTIEALGMMMCATRFLLLLLLPASCCAFSVGRRDALAAWVGSGAVGAGLLLVVPDAHASVAKTGPSSPFTGDYDDPNHPGCLRQVKVVGASIRGDGSRSPYPVMEITGYDGREGASSCSSDDRPTRADLWKVQGTVKSTNEAIIDFSPKGGPSKLTAIFDNNGMVFPDGNVWKKVPLGTSDRRPVDMSTLKSN